MQSVIIVSMTNLYYGNSAAVVRMNNYARAMALRELDVYLVSVYSFRSREEMVEVEPHIFASPKQDIRIRKGYDIFFILGFIRKIKKLIKEIEDHVVILNYSSTSSLLLDIGMLLFICKTRLYCEVNEVRKFSSSGQSVRSNINNYILEKTYKYYDGLVFISKNIQEFYKIKTQKSIIVPILSDCKKAFSISNGINTLNIVFVGSVSFPKENLEELLEGFCLFSKEQPNACLDLYGVLTEPNRKKLEHFMDKTCVHDKIVYHGVLQHSEVETVLSSAGALVLPRANNKQNYYGFSTKLSEYAVSGAPIIMTNTGVVADYFQDGTNCLMCEGYDRNAFKQKFDELAQMSVAEKQQMAENAYLVAKNYFDYKLYPETLLNFLFK